MSWTAGRTSTARQSPKPRGDALGAGEASRRGERGAPLEPARGAAPSPSRWPTGAYNARSVGVRHYIAQYMFNTPAGTYAAMDLAKMLAKMELIESLHTEEFTTYRQVRAGLLHFAPDLDVAKGQLAASTLVALAVKPHIIHVVGFTEGDHAARADEVIESCKIVRGVLKNALFPPDMTADPRSWRVRRSCEARRIVRAFVSGRGRSIH